MRTGEESTMETSSGVRIRPPVSHSGEPRPKSQLSMSRVNGLLGKGACGRCDASRIVPQFGARCQGISERVGDFSRMSRFGKPKQPAPGRP